ncbi:MAG: hypothetical protein JSV09_09920 [Thermoplasmata archaeon]|nr:MAG: hypothetical protein JSV09_09920 [Thermoplasmata archaeon]
MLEIVTSKIAMMIAAMVILTSILAIYALQRDSGQDLEIQNIADKIAGTIDDLNTLSGETIVNLTFKREKEGIYVRPTLEGKSYEIMISRYRVLITQGNRRGISNLIGPVHLWRPLKNSYNQTNFENIDNENKTLELTSGEDFKIQRKLVEVSGENQYLTFIYVEMN